MPSVAFPDEPSFVKWHDSKCVEEGIPHPGFNAATGEVALKAQWTVAWVEPVLASGKIAVTVDTLDTELLKLEPVVVDETASKVSFEWAKPLPDEWEGEAVPIETAVVEDLRRSR